MISATQSEADKIAKMAAIAPSVPKTTTFMDFGVPIQALTISVDVNESTV